MAGGWTRMERGLSVARLPCVFNDQFQIAYFNHFMETRHRDAVQALVAVVLQEAVESAHGTWQHLVEKVVG
jgi:hypothetical protein